MSYKEKPLNQKYLSMVEKKNYIPKMDVIYEDDNNLNLENRQRKSQTFNETNNLLNSVSITNKQNENFKKFIMINKSKYKSIGDGNNSKNINDKINILTESKDSHNSSHLSSEFNSENSVNSETDSKYTKEISPSQDIGEQEIIFSENGGGNESNRSGKNKEINIINKMNKIDKINKNIDLQLVDSETLDKRLGEINTNFIEQINKVQLVHFKINQNDNLLPFTNSQKISELKQEKIIPINLKEGNII
jgi:hypothetical protein